MIKKLDITDPEIAQKVLNLQIQAYEVEAKLIDFYEIPPLKDTMDILRQCGETFYGYFLNGELIGAISFKKSGDVLDLHRLMVSPAHFRKGIAKDLLQFVEAHEDPVGEMIVSTGSDNIPAVNFYKKMGFTETGRVRVSDHLSLTLFKKKMK